MKASTLALAFVLSAIAPAFANQLVNGDFESGNTGFTSDYTFVESCGEFGAYMIAASPADVCIGNWLDFGDHTTGSGLMMIVDGSPRADKIVWSETIDVKANTNYVLRYWAAASDTQSDRHGPSSLQAMINGAPVGRPLGIRNFSGWRKKTVRWNSASNTTATISLIDLKHRKSGNDFALDDIGFRAAAP